MWNQNQFQIQPGCTHIQRVLSTMNKHKNKGYLVKTWTSEAFSIQKA